MCIRDRTATVMTVCRRLLEYSEDISARSYSSQRPLRTNVRVQVLWDPRTIPSPRKKEISAHKAAMVTPAGEAIGPITGLLPSCMPAKSAWTAARRAERYRLPASTFTSVGAVRNARTTDLSSGWVTSDGTLTDMVPIPVSYTHL